MKHTDVYKRTPATSACSSGSYDDRLVVKLLCNYRSHPDILHIPNRSFYDGELLPCADESARTMLCSWPELPEPGFPMVFHGVVGRDVREERSPSFFNVEEISVVMRYVECLLRSRQPKILQKQIGIISPYRKQVRYSTSAFRYTVKTHIFRKPFILRLWRIRENNGREFTIFSELLSSACK